ncbi:MAG: hypothetical protein WC100_21040 [Sterolibacterium sp.]
MKEENQIFSSPLSGLKFKGKRNYLQGPDIQRAALNCLAIAYPASAITDIDIVFHGMARTGLLLLETDNPGTEPIVQLRCKVGGERKKFLLVEDGMPILERVEYAEEEIVAATEIQVATATATSVSALPYSNIERWVSMVKALHLAVYPDLVGKWLYVRGKFDQYQDVYDPPVQHQVVVQANFNSKLTRTSVLVDQQRLGDIFFSLE